MVGFQTKLHLGRAEAHLPHDPRPGAAPNSLASGGLHRNTFINSPRLLDAALRLKALPHVRFAGQITGVEGYVESAAIGLLAGRFAAAERRGEPLAGRRPRRPRSARCSATSPAARKPRPSSR